MAESPVKVTEVFKLTDVDGGINPTSINFKSVTMESDKFVCVRDTSGDQNSIVIVDLSNKTNARHKIAADSAIMNPVSKVLALKAASTLQIFNLELKMKMKSYTMPEPVTYWRWISTQTIALVTATAVYHWSIEGSSDPRKVFERKEELADTQILNYKTDSTETWLVLVGVKQQADKSLQGVIQLYSVEKSASRVIEGHAACFVEFAPTGTTKCCLMCVASNSAQGGKVFVMEVPTSQKSDTTFERKVTNVSFSSVQDFPVAISASAKYGVLFLVTRSGYMYLFDLPTATLLCSEVITQDPIFVTATDEKTSGLLGVNTRGTVLSIAVNEQTIVRYIQKNLNNYEVARRIASTANLSGADELFLGKFNSLLNEMNIQEAVKLVAEAPNNLLRTRETIQRFSAIPPLPGQQPALSVYFKHLLDKGKLNNFESVELGRIVLQKAGGSQYIQKLMTEEKLEESEELGDILHSSDPDLALKIYFKGGAHLKVIQTLVHRGDFPKILAYCQKVNYKPEWAQMLQGVLNLNPDGAVQFAVMLHEMEGGPALEPNQVIDMFVQRNLIKQVTAYLLDILKNDREEEGALQTRLLEINLMYSPPQVADQILGQQPPICTHFDPLKVATLCEKAQLYQRALESYIKVTTTSPETSVIQQIKRVIINTHAINPDWLVDFFGDLSKEDSLDCLKDLLTHNQRQNFKICVQVATKYSEELGADQLIDIFLQFKSYEALYYYLGSIIMYSKDPEVHFRYIEAATRVGQYSEVERVTRESTVYEPERTKNFLKDAKLADLWPFINVCDQHDYLDELIRHLYDTQNLKYVDMYVQKRNPMKTPVVVGALLDCDCSEEYVKNLILSVGNMCPIEPLVEEVEKRNRLKLLQGWLEARATEKNEEPTLHNALGKIYIDSNQNAQEFLNTNEFFDCRVLGKYCENRDPLLAFAAYKRGQCDEELVKLTNKNGMFKQQARYLVQRQNQELWASVLVDSEHRKQLVDQVVQTALPETTVPEEVSTTVKAFMTAELPHELTELLEKIILHGNSEFKNNRFLQNLLILTAIKTEKTRVMDYINRLNNYDASDIAKIAEGADLYEEAFVIYKKFGDNVHAVKVLLDDIDSVERAYEFAERVSEASVWSVVAAAQLKQDLIPDAIDSYLKANDPEEFQQVIAAAENGGYYQDLVRYLHMARTESKVKEGTIDTELVYAYAKTNRLADLEEFISAPNVAQVQYIADRCFNEELYEAAKILFTSISNYARLAVALVRLQSFYAAVDAAQKANSIKTWKEVNIACVIAGEFRLAQMCALHIIVQADELEEFIHFYEEKGFFEELISVMKAGLGHERAHMGMFTELGVIYAKYKPDKLMEHIKLFHRRVNVHKLIRICEQLHHWAEARFLYTHNDEYDNAAKVMMQHTSESWDHEIFKDTVSKVSSVELCYQAVHFYIKIAPESFTDLLSTIASRVDHERIVYEVRKYGQLPLLKPFLETVQDSNVKGVNEALNELFIEEEDYESLRISIDQFDNFDQLALSEKLKKHELLEFRRIAAMLYKKNKKWKQSVELSKKDKMYKDAMETVAEGEDKDLAEELIRFFVDNGHHESFCACLYTCFDLMRPDVALELAWRHKIFDFVMPYLIQLFKEYTEKIADMSERLDKKESAEPTAPQADMGMGMHAIMPPAQQGYPMMPQAAPPMPMYNQPSPGMGW